MKRAVAELVKHGVATNTNGQCAAVAPAGAAVGWFKYRKGDPAPWWEQFAYFSVYLRSRTSPLSLRAHVVLSLLYSLAKGGCVASGQTYLGLGVLLGINRRTVARGIKALEEHQLVKMFPAKNSRAWFSVGLVRPSKEQLEWFQSFPSQDSLAFSGMEEFSQNQQLAETEAVRRDHDGNDQLAAQTDRKDELASMRRWGYPENVVEKALRILAKSCGREIGFGQFLQMVTDADRDHKRNQAQGKYSNVMHSGALFLRMIEDHVGRKQARCDAELRAMSSTPHADDVLFDAAKKKRTLDAIAAIDPLTAPLEPALFELLIEAGAHQITFWVRDFGETVCRQALLRAKQKLRSVKRYQLQRSEFDDLLKVMKSESSSKSEQNS